LSGNFSRIKDEYDQLSARKTWLGPSDMTQRNRVPPPHVLLPSSTSCLKLMESMESSTSLQIDESKLMAENRTLNAKVRSLEEKLKGVHQSETFLRRKSEKMTREIQDVHAQKTHWEHAYDQLLQRTDSVMQEMAGFHEYQPGNSESIARRAMVTPQLRRDSNVSFFGYDFVQSHRRESMSRLCSPSFGRRSTYPPVDDDYSNLNYAIVYNQMSEYTNAAEEDTPMSEWEDSAAEEEDIRSKWKRKHRICL